MKRRTGRVVQRYSRRVIRDDNRTVLLFGSVMESCAYSATSLEPGKGRIIRVSHEKAQLIQSYVQFLFGSGFDEFMEPLRGQRNMSRDKRIILSDAFDRSLGVSLRDVEIAFVSHDDPELELKLVVCLEKYGVTGSRVELLELGGKVYMSPAIDFDQLRR